jgi:Phytanoyl-CoA dioxygenase (PhyH)
MLLNVDTENRGGKKSRQRRRSGSSMLEFRYTSENEVPKRRILQPKQQSSAKKTITSNKSSAAFGIQSGKIDLKTQLCYARNGHAVLRRFIQPNLLKELHPLLAKYCKNQELVAWRQKVEVAADTDASPLSKDTAVAVANSCRSVSDCQVKLEQLLGQSQVRLPFLQYFNTWRTFPLVTDLTRSLAESAAVLMDVHTVRLYQDAIFWKRGDDGPTPWHTDARMAPFDTSHMITFWIPLDPVQKSGLVFCSKSHADFALPFWTDQDTMSSLDARYTFNECVDYMPMMIGDLTVHSGWTLHCTDSGDKEERMALAITFVDGKAPIRQDALSSLKGDREDVWSYQVWVKDVPSDCFEWDHPQAPLLWPHKLK